MVSQWHVSRRSLFPIAPISIRQTPPIHADRLAVGWIVGPREIHFLRIFLKTFDLVRGVGEKRPLVFVACKILLLNQPALQQGQSEFSDGPNPVRCALA